MKRVNASRKPLMLAPLPSSPESWMLRSASRPGRSKWCRRALPSRRWFAPGSCDPGRPQPVTIAKDAGETGQRDGSRRRPTRHPKIRKRVRWTGTKRYDARGRSVWTARAQ
jgi:hypothetical protein